jgi:hypothetical protein
MYQRSKSRYGLLSVIVQVIQPETTRGGLAITTELALVTGLDLQPKMEEGAPFSYSLAVQVDAYVGVGRDRPNETLAAESAHHQRRAVISFESVV